jgi:hypothetical protein
LGTITDALLEKDELDSDEFYAIADQFDWEDKDEEE